MAESIKNDSLEEKTNTLVATMNDLFNSSAKDPCRFKREIKSTL